MKAYVGQARGEVLIAKLAQLGFGEMTQPREFPPRREPYLLDNGAFANWRAGKPFDSVRFARALALAKQGPIPDAVICPDVVADPVATRKMAAIWLPQIKPLRAWYVAQDGLKDEDARAILADFDGLFVGGSLEWKLATAAHWVRLAHECGKPCHVGRVGTARRVVWAKGIQADSIDSCTPLYAPRNLRAFCGGFFAQGFQMDLFNKSDPKAPPSKAIPVRKPKAKK